MVTTLGCAFFASHTCQNVDKWPPGTKQSLPPTTPASKGSGGERTPIYVAS